jgi:hypothetical protein
MAECIFHASAACITISSQRKICGPSCPWPWPHSMPYLHRVHHTAGLACRNPPSTPRAVPVGFSTRPSKATGRFTNYNGLSAQLTIQFAQESPYSWGIYIPTHEVHSRPPPHPAHQYHILPTYSKLHSHSHLQHLGWLLSHSGWTKVHRTAHPQAHTTAHRPKSGKCDLCFES